MLISTEAFTDALKGVAKLRGVPDMRWAILPHPICNLDEDLLMERARSVVEQFVPVVTRG